MSIQLANLTVSALISLYNEGVEDFNPAGFTVASGFKNKAAAIDAIESMCEAGNMAVSFDGDTATIIDASAVDDGGEGEGENDDAKRLADETGAVLDTLVEARADYDAAIAEQDGPAIVAAIAARDTAETAYNAAKDAQAATLPVTIYGDGKGAIAPSGFVYGSDAWLRANPRGTVAREEYRKNRKLAARKLRKTKAGAIVA